MILFNGQLPQVQTCILLSREASVPNHERKMIPTCYWYKLITQAPGDTVNPWESISQLPARTDRTVSQWDRFSTQQYLRLPVTIHKLAHLGHAAGLPGTRPQCGYWLSFYIEVKEHRNSYPGFQNCDIHPKTLQLASCCQPRDSRPDDDHLSSLLG